MRRFIHGWLRENYLSRVAKVIYSFDPVPGWSWDYFQQQQQFGNPGAEIKHNNINAMASAVIAALVWRKP